MTVALLLLAACVGLLMNLKILPERLADIFDVGFQQSAGLSNLPTLAETQDLGMFNFGALHAVRQ